MKRLKFQLIVRIGLLLLLLTAAAAITWNFLGRQREEAAASERGLLSDQIERRSVNFEHSEFRGGNLLFRLRAETDTLTADGQHELQHVELMIYEATGEPSDWVRGHQAVYQPDKKQIEFLQAVQIQLADETEIFSEAMSANLETEQIEIDRNFTFHRGDVRGMGGMLTYFTDSRRLEVDQGFQLWIPGAASNSHAQAQRAVYRMAEGRLELEGDVNLAHPGQQLRSHKVTITMDEKRRMKRLSAGGHAELRTEPNRIFQGETIEFEFAAGGRVSFFDVLSSPRGRARYREDSPVGARQLEADQLRMLVDDDPEAGGRISQFLADRKVALRTPGKRLQEIRSDHLEGSFGVNGLVRQLKMNGGVEVLAQDGASLLGGTLVVDLDPQQEPLTIHAADRVLASVPFAGGTRSLSTSEELELEFKDGQLERARCPRDCVLTTRGEGTRTRLETPRLEAAFMSGRPVQVNARQGVEVTQEDAGTRRVTRSRELILAYRDGLLASAVQQGDFRWEQESAEGVSLLTGERASFDPATGFVRVSGQQPLLTQREAGSTESVMTWAERFRLHRTRAEVSAYGAVRTRLERDAGTLEITAQQMQLREDGWIEYLGRPQVSERQGRVTAEVVRLLPSQDRMEAERNVDSLLVTEAADGRREYQILSQRMQLKRAERNALYQGDVKARSADLSLESQHLRLEFADDALSELDRVTAWDDVQVEDPTRTARGDRSFFFPAEGRIQVFGSPATVVDSKQGKAVGGILTFFTGNERLLVQNRKAGDRP